MKLFFFITALFISTVVNSQDSTCLGVGYGGHYNGEQFINYVNDLQVSHYFITINWDWYEPSAGQYQDSILMAFLDQVPLNSNALIRIAPRGNTIYNDPITDYTVPMDLTVNGPYYDMIFHIVSLDTAEKVKYYENLWEFNFLKHWGGENNPSPDPISLGLQYAELTRTTESAINTANPNAEFILGGTNRNTSEFADTLIRSALSSLNQTDPVKGHCDYYDQHLYRDLYGIPDDLNWFKEILDDYSAFANKPIICTEYGGPLPGEFMTNDSINQLVTSIVQADPCLAAGDMLGFGLPDHYRMFAFGIEDELEAKRDSIQGNNYVQRTMLGLANGVNRFYWWSLESNWHQKITASDTCYIKGQFGKLALMENDHNNDFTNPDTSYMYYKNFSGIFKNISTVFQDSSYLSQNIYFFRVINTAGDTLYVVWEKRDQFYGVYDPPTNFIFNTPWSKVNIRNVFGRNDTLMSSMGNINLELKDIPLILSNSSSSAFNLIENASFNINVYPNPTNDHITIDINGYNCPIEVEIYDLSGRLLETTNTTTIPLKKYSKGIYVFKVSYGDVTEEVRVVRE